MGHQAPDVASHGRDREPNFQRDLTVGITREKAERDLQRSSLQNLETMVKAAFRTADSARWQPEHHHQLLSPIEKGASSRSAVRGSSEAGLHRHSGPQADTGLGPAHQKGRSRPG
jgi:hypothetical protein